MKYWYAAALFLLTIFSSSILSAQESRERGAILMQAKWGITTLRDTAKAGIITDAQAQMGIERYVAEASAAAGKKLNTAEILATPSLTPTPQELTRLQRWVGWVSTLPHFFYIVGILMVAVCVSWLFGGWLKALMAFFTMIPVGFYEFIFYVGGVALIAGGLHFSHSIAEYLGLTGCLMVGGALVFSATRRPNQMVIANYFMLLCGVCTIAAVLYHSSMIGFVAILALMGALGFSVVTAPLCYCIGFNDEESLGRATAAAFVILALFVGLRMTEHHLPLVMVFETGALFVGSFVGYLGLLIASSRWYKRDKYILRQLITIVAGVLSLVIGSLWGVGELQKIGGTFFCLYLIEKVSEVPIEKKRNYAYLGILIGSLLCGMALAIRSHPEAFRPYLLF